MASTYTQPKKNGEDLQEELKKQVSAQQTAAQQSAADLQQISQQAASLGGYTPSAQLKQAQQRVTQLLQQKPAEFTSAYTQKLQDQFESIMNRQPFNYDLGTDPLWNQYSDMYVQKGRRAMQDTMGQAAALTGGYGNSYAQGAGQAAYGNYLQELNARAPEFQQQAYGRWQQEGADMLDRYNALQNRENIEYGRYQDALDNYWGELDRAQQQAADLYNREYTAFTNNREYAYNTALTILQGGKMPSDELLRAAGLSAADANMLMSMYKPKKSSGGSSNKTATTGTNKSSVPKSTATKQTSVIEKNIIDPEEEIKTLHDYERQRMQDDPFYAAQKNVNKSLLALSAGPEIEQKRLGHLIVNNSSTINDEQAAKEGTDIESYNNYVENAILSKLDSGKIDKDEAKKLAYRFLVN